MTKHVPKRWSRLTKRDALLICIELWAWIAGGKSRAKEDWPRWASNGGDVPLMEQYCPCCSYVAGSNSDDFCEELCPIVWTDDIASNCTHTDSPFRLWRRTNNPAEARKQARRIVKLAKDTLAKLPKRGKA